MKQGVPIGRAAEVSGVKVPTIRYYENIGLLMAAPRTASNRRLYDEETIARLRFIRHARQLGFEIQAIRQLLQLAGQPEQSCDRVDAIAREHLSDIDSKVARLVTLRAEIQRMLDECARGRISACRVIELLAHHEQCLHPAH